MAGPSSVFRFVDRWQTSIADLFHRIVTADPADLDRMIALLEQRDLQLEQYLNLPVNLSVTRLVPGTTTWTKMVNAQTVSGILIGGGGSGGVGSIDGSHAGGGGGGGAGSRLVFSVPASFFGETETLHVGLGGSAGADGGATSLGTLMSAPGGKTGAPGSTVALDPYAVGGNSGDGSLGGGLSGGVVGSAGSGGAGKDAQGYDGGGSGSGPAGGGGGGGWTGFALTDGGRGGYVAATGFTAVGLAGVDATNDSGLGGSGGGGGCVAHPDGGPGGMPGAGGGGGQGRSSGSPRVGGNGGGGFALIVTSR